MLARTASFWRIGRAGLVRLLLRRARDTDSIGLVDANRLCAVLADTEIIPGDPGLRHLIVTVSHGATSDCYQLFIGSRARLPARAAPSSPRSCAPPWA